MELYKNKDVMVALYKKYNSANKIANKLGINPKTVYVWLKKHEINTRDASQGARKYNLDESFFREINNEHKAYWFGFLMADGCVYKGSDKNSFRLQINLTATDIDQLKKFNVATSSNYPIRIVDVIDRKTGVIYKSAQLKINSTKMCKDLIKHGLILRKSIVCEIPDLDDNLKRHFLRGYFDGDGCITVSNRQWSASIVGGKNMLSALQNYMSENEISSALYKINHSRAMSLEISSHKMVEKFRQLIYKDATVCLERKHIKFHDFKIFYCPAA